MTEIDKIVNEINNEIVRLRMKRDYIYYAREFKHRADNIIKNGRTTRPCEPIMGANHKSESDV